MKILLLGINFAPELTGIGKYSGEMVEWLAQRGHSIRVVTAPPYYPLWKIGEGWRNTWQSAHWGETGHVVVHRAPLWVPKRVTGRSRLLHLASFALASIPSLIASVSRQRPDLLIMVAPTLMNAPAALLAGWLLRRPVWLHVQDFEVDAMLGMGVINAPRGVSAVVSGIERFLMRRFHRVSTISPRMCDRLRAKGVAPERVVLTPNWVDLSTIHPLEGDNAYRREWGVANGSSVVLYSGNMGEKQGLDIVVDVARRLAHRTDVTFVLAGEGAARERLQAAAHGLVNMRWLPLQPAERLNEFLNAADVHVLPQRGDAADLVMPSKLTGMLASGRATVGTAHSGTQLGDVLDACGVRVTPEDSAALSAAIEALVDDPARRGALGRAGREFAMRTMLRDAILEQAEVDLLEAARR